MSYKTTDVKTPGIVAIAKKWKLPVAKVMELVNQGAEVEREHNKSIVKARQVARDHINERPDYYKKLKKMEKTPVSMKEETGVLGVRGLGYVTGDPGVDLVQNYIDTNAMAYEDENGSKLEMIKKKHLKYHNDKLGFNFFDPTDGNASNKTLKEAYAKKKLDELGGNMGYEGLTDTPPRARRDIQIAEGPKLDKAKKIAMAGMTAANMYTMADVAGRATEGGHGSPKGDVVRAASALPGTVGWGATAIHYGKKGYDLAKQALKSKKDKMKNEEQIKEDLRKWFREKWVRYDTKGNIKGPCAREEGEGKPKCRPLASARAMSKTERAKSARRKRREDPVADRQGKGGKPINVQTEETLLEKNVPTNPALWARAKAQAKAKFDVYPSAYANGWASKWYKSKGGGWKSAANESVDEACWDTHKQEGMKKKGNKMVPNCVPKEEVEIDEVAAWQRKEGKNPEGGLNRKGIASYRRENPGSKLSMAVTTPPSKLKPGSKAAKRRKSFCARMGGMPGPMKDEKGRPTRKALSLRKWNCEEENKYPQTAERSIYEDDTPKKEVVYTHKKGPLYGTVTQHADGTIETRRKVGMFWRGRTHSSKESAIAHLENDGKKKKLREETDAGDETNMAKSQLKALGAKSKNLVSNLKGSKNLPAWVQSKIAVAKDGITAVDDYMTHSDKQVNELKAPTPERLGRYIKRASGERKKALEGPKADVKTWERKHHFIQSAFKKLTKENSGQKDWDVAVGPMGKFAEQTYFHPSHKHTARLSKEKAMKPDNIIEPGGVKGHVSPTMHTEKKETKMENQNLINEALENILENNLNEMKENLLAAINEKAMEKLEERKKAIAADYFAQ